LKKKRKIRLRRNELVNAFYCFRHLAFSAFIKFRQSVFKTKLHFLTFYNNLRFFPYTQAANKQSLIFQRNSLQIKFWASCHVEQVYYLCFCTIRWKFLPTWLLQMN